MHPQLALPFHGELIIDNFAGGGGTSTGLEAAFGRPVDIAINHDPEALAMHAINHPHTLHLCESVWDVDPIKVTKNQPVGLVWLSPDCKHFSKAKGGKPVSKKIRGLAWVAIRKQAHTWRPAGALFTWLNSSDDASMAEAIKESQRLAGSRMPSPVHIGARPEEWVEGDEFAVVCLLNVGETVK